MYRQEPVIMGHRGTFSGSFCCILSETVKNDLDAQFELTNLGTLEVIRMSRVINELTKIKLNELLDRASDSDYCTQSDKEIPILNATFSLILPPHSHLQPLLNSLPLCAVAHISIVCYMSMDVSTIRRHHMAAVSSSGHTSTVAMRAKLLALHGRRRIHQIPCPRC